MEKICEFVIKLVMLKFVEAQVSILRGIKSDQLNW